MMRTTWRSGAAAVLSLSLFGCGDDSPSQPGSSQGTVNEAAATTLTSSTFNALQTASGGNGQSAGFQLMAAGLGAISIVTPSSGASPIVGSPDGSGFDVSNTLRSAMCDCNANSCTFDGCGDGSGFTITGTISWTDTSFDADYSVAGSTEGATYNFSVFAQLTYSPTSINGVVSSSGSFSVMSEGQSSQGSWESETTFNNVTFNSGGQPTGGSISVTATVTSNGETYSASGTVNFS